METMKKQQLTQTQTQAQAQIQQTTSQAGGEVMSKLQQNEVMIYFVTFPTKLPAQKAKEIVNELRKRFPGRVMIFTPRPPRGKKFFLDIGGTLVIVTIPYEKEAPQSPNKQEQETPTQVPQSFEGGFTLAELAKVNKIKTKT